MAINHKQIKEELLNRIRNADIISTTVRGVTTAQDTFSGNGVQTDFVLSNTGIKNIRLSTVDTVELTPFVDYTFDLVDYVSGDFTISFTNPPSDDTDNVIIDYDHSSSGDRIYDDFPILAIKAGDKFPRIGFDIDEETTQLQSFDRVLYQSTLPFIFSAYGVGRNNTEDLENDLRNFLISIRTDLQRLEYIEPTGRSKIKPLETIKDKKIFKKDLRFKAPFEFETI